MKKGECDVDKSYYKMTLEMFEDIKKNHSPTQAELTAIEIGLDAIKSLYAIEKYLDDMFEICETEKIDPNEIIFGVSKLLWKLDK